MMEFASLFRRGECRQHDGGHRCDGDNQCNDESDEKTCRTIYWGEGKASSYTDELGPDNPDEPGKYKMHG